VRKQSVIPRRSFFSTHDGICFSVSLVCHLIVFIALAVVFIANQRVGKQELTFSLEEDSTTTELVLNELPLENLQTQNEMPELDSPDMESLLQETPILARPADQLYHLASVSGQTADTTATRASFASSAKSEPAAQEMAKSRATFFGAEAYGNRFVFVIDSSKSMRGTRWESLCIELVRAIRSLSPDQEFFVISFDITAHPMLGFRPPRDLFLKPSTRNVTRIQNWLKSIQHGHETFPSSAMAIALQLRPDAIFLLSDGEIRDDTISRLREWNQDEPQTIGGRTAIPVHTVLLESQVGYATLERIAIENHGTFTPVVHRH
jgi:hypothetical protein